MVNDPDDRESAEETPEKPGVSIGSVCSAALKAAGRWLPRLGLYLFMVAMPLVVTGYPAYRIASHLAAYPAAKTVEARLDKIDVEDVREPDRHFDVIFSFTGTDGKKYTAILPKPWPSPGLQRKLDARYRDIDLFTLHLAPDGKVLMEEELARDSFAALTALMGLILAATVMYFMLRHRLARRMPDMLSAASIATTKSVVIGQSITLAVAALFLILVQYSPLLVPIPLYLGAYWGIALTLCLSLRLLVFENPRAIPPAKNDIAKLIAKAR